MTDISGLFLDFSSSQQHSFFSFYINITNYHYFIFFCFSLLFIVLTHTVNKMTTAQPPPPLPPVHQTPLPALNFSIVQSPCTYASNDLVTSTATATAPISKPTSYLGFSQQQQGKRKSFLSRGYESSGGSSEDESEEDDNSHRYSTESIVSEEHKFWQVHSSTTIIAPPSICSDQQYIANMDMAYVAPPLRKNTVNSTKVVKKKPRISLAEQVRDILGSTLDQVDEEIEREWENSRMELRNSLIVLPTISLTTTYSSV